MAEKEPIGVIGVGWVGLVTAVCFAELGHEVWARDIVQEKVDSLVRGEVPIHEPGLAELVQGNAERLHFTADIGDVAGRAELLFCCVDTPPTYSGDADLSRVMSVVDELGDSGRHVLVMKSTVPVGTGRSIGREHPGLAYVSNPEFLKEGSAVDDFMKPDRVVIGAGAESASFADRLQALYEPLGGELLRTDVASAEMIKLASNAFLATKISFINEIANVSEDLGADVTEVARGMGLDERIGSQFLRAGIGWGGSCLPGDESVLVRRQGRVWVWSLEELWERVTEEEELDADSEGAVYPEELEVLSWADGADQPEFRPVAAATKRVYQGDIIEVKTKMGRRVRCTPDHPLVSNDGTSAPACVKLAGELTTDDWLPVPLGCPKQPARSLGFDAVTAATVAELQPADMVLHPREGELQALPLSTLRSEIARVSPEETRHRPYNVLYAGSLRFREALELGIELQGSEVRLAREWRRIPFDFETDEAFWRVVGLYIAEGFCGRDPDGSPLYLQWSFHPTAEEDLVQEVADFWRGLGTRVRVWDGTTSRLVRVTSRLVASWWEGVLAPGTDCYEKRIPDAAWPLPAPGKRALLAGMWLGDGSWSYVGGGPSVTLEYGTVSRELADGVLRLLHELEVVASWRVGRATNSTRDAHWITISAADQVRDALFLVREEDRPRVKASLDRQGKRQASTGYRRRSGTAWVRAVNMTREPFEGPVFSLEVEGTNTFVTTGGLCVHNCFGKDVLSLRQLAANTGYHFQVLTAISEVNEIQKRRTIGKLQKHLGPLVGKTVALLGIAFKPNTDDIRDATSLVLAGRLLGEGATVRAYDPVAMDAAREVIPAAELCDSALEAVDGADAVVLVTEWPDFKELDWRGDVKVRMNTPLVVDGRNFLDREALVAAGFTYEGIGR